VKSRTARVHIILIGAYQWEHINSWGYPYEIKADFVAKLHIALKECSETEYWLELLIEKKDFYPSYLYGLQMLTYNIL
jgi:hypothetical protein